MLDINGKTIQNCRQELERKGWYPEAKLHIIWGFKSELELTRESVGLLDFELDQLNRADRRETIVVPSEFVGKGEGKYVIYSRLKAEAYEFVCGL